MKKIIPYILCISSLTLSSSSNPYQVSDLEWHVLRYGINETLPLHPNSKERMSVQDFYLLDEFDDIHWYLKDTIKFSEKIEAQYFEHNRFMNKKKLMLPEASQVKMITPSSIDSIADVTSGGSGFWELFNKTFEKAGYLEITRPKISINQTDAFFCYGYSYGSRQGERLKIWLKKKNSNWFLYRKELISTQ
ncbi:hypothetical protein [uncultured Roseivirga sp.]|uniref:hypothetical protein n=1 Tax=uncultured Roseivirga sp. TaxID=543088 RepID=UPI0030D8F6E8|tara:strand:- start:143650 stop:144222 length:573 start_codon:yes stop_codon:yes gene_type:complete